MSLQQKLTGTGIAIVTPFTANGDFDWPTLENLINFWIENKIEYLVVAGTTGESATLTREEEQELFNFVKEKAAGRIGLVAGIGGNDTREVVHAFQTMELDGYDAILSVAPYYNKPGQEGLYQHYKTIDAVAPLPIIMYNVPGRTGQSISAETTVRIAKDCKNIIATKEASGSFEQFNYIMKYKPAAFMLISGDDPIALPMIALGAKGVISVVANAYPKEFGDMIRLCLEGKFSEAMPLHLKFTDIITSLFVEGSPAGVKQYLQEMGLCTTNARLPVVPVSDAHAVKIKSLMATV